MLTRIAELEMEWSSLLNVCRDTCEHERQDTSMIHDLVDLAVWEKDHATNAYRQWFNTEHMEEEAAA
ncbi:MAG: ferritin-like domain-containing protein [Planctomycetota bacterium]